MRGQGRAERIAVGWIVINRMLRRNTTNLKAVTDGEFARRLAGVTQDMRNLARDLLAGTIPDTTNGSTMFFSPRSMPAFGEGGCCSHPPANDNNPCLPAAQRRLHTPANCRGGLRRVPGINPQQLRYFPSWTRTLVLQPQPARTDPMNILVYRK